MIKTAILVDGAFYRKRAYYFYGDKTPKERADELEEYCKRHIKEANDNSTLYRVFYYDCPPMDKQVYHPLTQLGVDFGTTKDYMWGKEFFKELTHRRKFAMRMGRLAEEQAVFTLKPKVLRQLFRNKINITDIKESDFVLDVKQKGVDMRIGVDISSLAFKKQVDRIILISGDSDFVPAAKQARREGLDFILDPMRSTIKEDLFEHIDGMRTKAPREPLKNLTPPT